MNPLFFAYFNNTTYTPPRSGNSAPAIAAARAAARTIRWTAMPGCTYTVKANGSSVATGLTGLSYTGTFTLYDVVQVQAILSTGTVLYTFPAIEIVPGD